MTQGERDNTKFGLEGDERELGSGTGKDMSHACFQPCADDPDTPGFDLTWSLLRREILPVAIAYEEEKDREERAAQMVSTFLPK